MLSVDINDSNNHNAEDEIKDNEISSKMATARTSKIQITSNVDEEIKLHKLQASEI